MKRFARSGRIAACAAMVALVAPPQLLVAAEPANVAATRAEPVAQAVPTTPIADVALQADGALCGQTVNLQGQPVANAKVVLDDGRQQVVTSTDAHGRFRFERLRGGAYRVRTGQQMKLCRAWKAGTAPPAANRGLMIVDGNQTILGQYCGSPVGAGWQGARELMRNPLVIGGLIAAAIAIPVALHNSDDDDPAS